MIFFFFSTMGTKKHVDLMLGNNQYKNVANNGGVRSVLPCSNMSGVSFDNITTRTKAAKS